MWCNHCTYAHFNKIWSANVDINFEEVHRLSTFRKGKLQKPVSTRSTKGSQMLMFTIYRKIFLQGVCWSLFHCTTPCKPLFMRNENNQPKPQDLAEGLVYSNSRLTCPALAHCQFVSPGFIRYKVLVGEQEW